MTNLSERQQRYIETLKKKEMLTLPEAAELLGKCESNVRYYADKGVITRIKKGVNSFYLTADVLRLRGKFDNEESNVETVRKFLADSENIANLINERDELSKKLLSDVWSKQYFLGALRKIAFFQDDALNFFIRFVGSVVNLNDREREIMHRFLLYGENIDIIAEDFGLTRNRVCQIRNRIFNKICNFDIEEYFTKRDELHNATKQENEELKKQINLLLEKNEELRSLANVDDELSPIDDPTLELARKLEKIHIFNDTTLSVRAMNCIKFNTDVANVAQLATLPYIDIKRWRNMGKKTLIELEDFLSQYNITFGEFAKYKSYLFQS